MAGGWAAGGLKLLRRALSSNSKFGCKMLMRKASATWEMVKGQPLAIIRSFVRPHRNSMSMLVVGCGCGLGIWPRCWATSTAGIPCGGARAGCS